MELNTTPAEEGSLSNTLAFHSSHSERKVNMMKLLASFMFFLGKLSTDIGHHV
jgi:hypothetical protein